MASESRKLERSSVEAYAAIAIGIAVAVIHMTWQWKVAAFAVMAILFVDLGLRSPWTYRWSWRYKIAAAAIGVFIVGSVGFNPVVEQYREDHKPTAAHFDVALTSLRICSWLPPWPANSIGIVVWASVENTGAPSVAKKWSLSIDIPGQPTVIAVPLHYSDGGSACGEAFLAYDALEDKTENHEVDGVVHGKLLFLAKGWPLPLISQEDASYTLSVRDKDGNSYRATRSVGDIGSYFNFHQAPAPLVVKIPGSP